MKPAPPPSAAPAGAARRFSGWDASFAAVLAAALSGAAAVFSLPLSSGSLFFPRVPSEFLSPAELQEERAAALSVLEARPEDLSALSRLAVVSFQEGPDKLLDCIEYGDRALSLGALDKRLFYYVGSCYESKGLNEYAAQTFEKYLRHEPADEETRLRLGGIYYRLDELEKAQAAFQAVLASRTGDALVSFNLAMVLRDRKEWAEGLRVLMPILQRDQTLPAGGYRLLGDLRRGEKDLDGALAAYREELKRSPDDAELLALAAEIHEESGRPEDALATWKRVLDLDSGSKQAAKRIRELGRKRR